jgi:hypothetical protein
MIDLGQTYTINTLFFSAAERVYPSTSGLEFYIGDDGQDVTNNQYFNALTTSGDSSFYRADGSKDIAGRYIWLVNAYEVAFTELMAFEGHWITPKAVTVSSTPAAASSKTLADVYLREEWNVQFDGCWYSEFATNPYAQVDFDSAITVQGVVIIPNPNTFAVIADANIYCSSVLVELLDSSGAVSHTCGTITNCATTSPDIDCGLNEAFSVKLTQ